MKQFFLIALSLFFFTCSFAGGGTLIQSTANIMDPSVWSGNQLPQRGDAVQFAVSKGLKGSNSFIHSIRNGLAYPRQAASAVFPYSFDPSKFINFSVCRSQGQVLMQWSAAQEAGTDIFQVECSTGGSQDWKVIAYAMAAGISLQQYRFKDKNLSAATVYYRIRQVKADGSFSFTAVQSVPAEDIVSDVKITGLPGKLLLLFPKAVEGDVLVRFVTPAGQVAGQQTLSQPVGQVVVNTNLIGNYIVSISNGQGLNLSRQIIL
ncbi:MAG TPA: hypothetical protein VFR58_15865 [Flavisolibacter sp.]|nr:hypothetical protein [Flavisolibacter sp.]